MRRKKNETPTKPKPQPKKWIQKEGSNCDDIIFTNGEMEVDFDEWLERYYNK